MSFFRAKTEADDSKAGNSLIVLIYFIILAPAEQRRLQRGYRWWDREKWAVIAREGCGVRRKQQVGKIFMCHKAYFPYPGELWVLIPIEFLFLSAMKYVGDGEQAGALTLGNQQFWVGRWVNFPCFPVIPGWPLGEMYQSMGTSHQLKTLLSSSTWNLHNKKPKELFGLGFF